MALVRGATRLPTDDEFSTLRDPRSYSLYDTYYFVAILYLLWGRI